MDAVDLPLRHSLFFLTSRDREGAGSSLDVIPVKAPKPQAAPAAGKTLCLTAFVMARKSSGIF